MNGGARLATSGNKRFRSRIQLCVPYVDHTFDRAYVVLNNKLYRQFSGRNGKNFRLHFMNSKKKPLKDAINVRIDFQRANPPNLSAKFFQRAG